MQIDLVTNSQDMKDYVDVLQSSVRCIDNLTESIGDVNKVMDDVHRVSSMINDVDQTLFDTTDLAEQLSLDDVELELNEASDKIELENLPEVPANEPCSSKVSSETRPIMELET